MSNFAAKPIKIGNQPQKLRLGMLKEQYFAKCRPKARFRYAFWKLKNRKTHLVASNAKSTHWLQPSIAHTIRGKIQQPTASIEFDICLGLCAASGSSGIEHSVADQHRKERVFRRGRSTKKRKGRRIAVPVRTYVYL